MIAFFLLLRPADRARVATRQGAEHHLRSPISIARATATPRRGTRGADRDHRSIPLHRVALKASRLARDHASPASDHRKSATRWSPTSRCSYALANAAYAGAVRHAHIDAPARTDGLILAVVPSPSSSSARSCRSRVRDMRDVNGLGLLSRALAIPHTAAVSPRKSLCGASSAPLRFSRSSRSCWCRASFTSHSVETTRAEIHLSCLLFSALSGVIQPFLHSDRHRGHG